MIKLSFISFWNDFNINNNFIIDLFKKYEIEYTITKIKNSNLLIIGPFINKTSNHIIKNFSGKKFFYVSEPVDLNKYVLEFIEQKYFDVIFGSIEENLDNNYNKYPLYIMYLYAGNLMKNNDTFNNINNKLENEVINLDNKKFCTLINRHDKFNTRTKMYLNLKSINDKIDCPSILFNNCSNDEINSIGNINWINRYLFNLCPENKSCVINGYITEKLLNCCLSMSIPIYFGYFDDIDEKIFNKERIIFYNAYDEQSINDTKKIVEELYKNKTKLLDFYKKKIFTDNAMNTIIELELKFINKIKELFNI
jgi:hypothetical protein